MKLIKGCLINRYIVPVMVALLCAIICVFLLIPSTKFNISTVNYQNDNCGVELYLININNESDTIYICINNMPYYHDYKLESVYLFTNSEKDVNLPSKDWSHIIYGDLVIREIKRICINPEDRVVSIRREACKNAFISLYLSRNGLWNLFNNRQVCCYAHVSDLRMYVCNNKFLETHSLSTE